MIVRPTLTLICLFASLVARGDSLDVYANLTGKTVLMSSALPIPAGGMVSDLVTEKTNAIARMEGEFSKQGIAVLQDGPHFVVLFPERQRAFLTNGLPLRGPALAARKPQETLPAGTVNINADPGQVLALYSDISQRTILRPFALPPSRVRLKITCPVSREEAAYAMATVLALNGIAVVEDGEKFVQVVPMPQRSLVTARSPRSEPAARLLDPRQVPSTGNYDVPRPVSKMERDLERYRKALYEFLHYKSPPDRSAQRLLELYASLDGKTAEPSNQFDGMPVWFHIETPLSKDELMYAIETTFALNWFGIAQVDDQRIRLERLTKRGSRIEK
jgi:hypothetical protein